LLEESEEQRSDAMLSLVDLLSPWTDLLEFPKTKFLRIIKITIVVGSKHKFSEA